MDTEEITVCIVTAVLCFLYLLGLFKESHCDLDDDEDVEVIEEENGDITIHIRNPKR